MGVRDVMGAVAALGESRTEIKARDRDRFHAVLFNGPLLKADAIVVLCGEDAIPRVAVAAEAMRGGGGAHVLLSGGLHDPPRLLDAEHLAPLLMGAGVAPSRIIQDNEARNTWEQAVNTVARAMDCGWRRILLAASNYHMARAFLTFVHALDMTGNATLQVIPMPASHTPWFESPEGVTERRVDLLAVEERKVAEYQAKGHVASYERGLKYLEEWEGQ